MEPLVCFCVSKSALVGSSVVGVHCGPGAEPVKGARAGGKAAAVMAPCRVCGGVYGGKVTIGVDPSPRSVTTRTDVRGEASRPHAPRSGGRTSSGQADRARTPGF